MRKIILPSMVFSGVVARLLMAGLPNIEPVMLITILAGLKYGPKYGATTGFFIMLISDFYLGLPGPWTLYTAPSFALVGLIAGLIGKYRSRIQLAGMTAGLTALYDLLTNVGWALNWGLPILPTLVLGIPFSMIHIISNVCIVTVTLPYLSRVLDVLPGKVGNYIATKIYVWRQSP